MQNITVTNQVGFQTLKPAKSLEIKIPKEKTFDLPEGDFLAKIEDIKLFPKQTGTGVEQWVRITFNVVVPELPDLNTLAGRNFKFSLHPGSELRNFLGYLLGNKFFTDGSGKTVNLVRLIGIECGVTLVHFQGKGFDKPMVVVASVHPVSNSKLAVCCVSEGRD